MLLAATEKESNDRATPALPQPVLTARPGLHALAKPGFDGLDAYRSRGQALGLSQTCGLFRRTGGAWRGADRYRRNCAQHRRLGRSVCRQTLQQGPPGAAPAGYPGSPGGRRQNLHANIARGPLWLSSVLRGAIRCQIADQSLQAEGAKRRRRGIADPGIRPLRRAGERSRLSRRRNHGFGRLSDQ
ncbi:hypothetical protein MnTg04_01058 [bacterium MnTg04]|nr:hypothetical protein MnTg04_01058 [bacterium MnTg04]